MERRKEKILKATQVENLEFLVEEMIKDEPEEAFIKSFMQKSGLSYSEDPIERLNTVLQALHGQKGRKKEAQI